MTARQLERMDMREHNGLVVARVLRVLLTNAPLSQLGFPLPDEISDGVRALRSRLHDGEKWTNSFCRCQHCGGPTDDQPNPNDLLAEAARRVQHYEPIQRPSVAVIRLQTPTRDTDWSELMDFIACQDVNWIVLDDTRIDRSLTLSKEEAYMVVCFLAAGMPMTTLYDLLEEP